MSEVTMKTLLAALLAIVPSAFAIRWAKVKKEKP
jgi:hypothetical protein